MTSLQHSFQNQKKITLFKLFSLFFAFFSKKIRIYTKETYKPLFLLEACAASSFHCGTAKKNQIGNCQEGLLPAFLIDFLREAHRWQKKTFQKTQPEIRTKSSRFQTCVTFQRKTLSLFRIKTPEKNAPVPEPAELFPRPDFQECKIKNAEIARLLSYQKFALQTFVSTAVLAGRVVERRLWTTEL